MTAPDGSQPVTPARRRTRLLAWLVIAANVGLGAAYAGLFVVLVLAGKTRGADFTAFYTGWKTVLEGHGSQLYDPALQAEVQRRVLEGQTFEGGFAAFVNPPHMVLPYTPLGLLPLDAAYLAWAGVQALLLVAIVAMLLRGVARDWTRVERLGLVACVVAFPAVAMAFYQGAFALVLVASVLAALAAMDQRRDVRAGGLLALASVKPQGMFGMGIAVLLARRPAALAALVGWGLGLVVLATAVLGPGIWASYLRFLGTYASSFDKLSANPSVMWNLRGTLALLLGRDSAATVDAIAYTGFAIGIVAIAFLWRRGWSRGAIAGAIPRVTAGMIARVIPRLTAGAWTARSACALRSRSS